MPLRVILKINWIVHGEILWMLLFDIIVNISSFRPLNNNVNTTLKYYRKQALKKKLMGRIMNFFTKKKLGHEIFSSMIFFFHQMIYTTYKQHKRLRRLTKIKHKIWYIKLSNTTTKPYVLFQNAITLLKNKRNYKIK